MGEKTGYIYIFTNPSFPEYVKIGYTANVPPIFLFQSVE